MSKESSTRSGGEHRLRRVRLVLGPPIISITVAAITACGANGFCASHSCIPNFDNGHGSIVQCADGMWSHSGGVQGACSDHGGERGYTP
jgi:hypothetical protein